MVVTLLTGMTGHLRAVAETTALGRCAENGELPRRGAGLGAELSLAGDESVVLDIVAPDLCLRKAVHADGRTVVRLERFRDRVDVEVTASVLRFLRPRKTIVVPVVGLSDERLCRVKAIMAPSLAARALRRLCAVLEARGGDETAEQVAVRLTGAVLAIADGEDGAVARLSRAWTPEITTRLAAVPGRAGDVRLPVPPLHPVVNGQDVFIEYGDPAGRACELLWAMEVERAWYRLVREGMRGGSPAVEN